MEPNDRWSMSGIGLQSRTKNSKVQYYLSLKCRLRRTTFVVAVQKKWKLNLLKLHWAHIAMINLNSRRTSILTNVPV